MLELATGRVHLYRYGVSGLGYLFSDTTAKSSKPNTIGHALSPDWVTMVGPYKRGEIDEYEYAYRYLTMLHELPDTIYDALEVASSQGRLRIMLLACYCSWPKFCHRHLACRYIADRITDAYYTGEAYSVDNFEGPLLSPRDTEHEAYMDTIYEGVINEICHYRWPDYTPEG